MTIYIYERRQHFVRSINITGPAFVPRLLVLEHILPWQELVELMLKIRMAVEQDLHAVDQDSHTGAALIHEEN